MAQTYATEVAGLGTTPTTKSSGAVQGGRIRRFRASITMAAQASADTVVLAKVPAGYAFAYGVINASATLATATVAVGNSTTADKYRTAAVFTAAAPTLFGLSTAVDDDPLTAEEDVILTIGAASLPSSGTLIVDMYFSAP